MNASHADRRPGLDSTAGVQLATPSGGNPEVTGIVAPTERARPRVITTMALARFGIMLGLMTPLAAGLALKLQTFMPQAEAVPILGTITSLGALAALFFDPVFGRLSDRTIGRFGRRRPWLIFGSVGLLACLVLIALAPNVMLVGVGWILAQVIGNAAVAAHTATLADQLPPVQRGRVSGLIGVMQQVASLGAAWSASLFTGNMLLLFLVPGVIGLLLVLAFAFVLPDQVLKARPRTEGSVADALKTFWVSPRQHPDFAFAWISRFLVVLANFMFVTFRLFWLQHELELPKQEAAAAMATGVLIFTIALAVSGQIAGWLSDKIDRRKIFIAASAVIFAVGTALLTRADSQQGFWLAELVLGIGFGVYVAVDLALVVDVLPNPEDAGKDLGVFNIAMAGPQAVAPGLAAAIIALGGGENYDLMLYAAAAIALIGGALILPVKSVR